MIADALPKTGIMRAIDGKIIPAVGRVNNPPSLLAFV